MKNQKVLLLLALLSLFACQNTHHEKTVVDSVNPVKTATVRTETFSLPVRSTGIIATSEEIKLSFKTGGLIAQTRVTEGQSVKKGQLLAELNLSEIKAQFNQAKNALEKASRDYTRAANLYRDSVATLEQVQNAETALNMTQSVYDAARFNLNYSKIVAPGDGVILKQLFRENELVAPGYPVYILGIRGSNWIIRTGLSDRDLVRIEPGDSAAVRIDAWPDEKFSATVLALDEVPNPATGTFEIELLLSDTDKRLATGFIANMEIFPSRKDSFYLVPVEAILEASHKIAYVFVPQPDGTAKKQKVRVEWFRAKDAVISEGLEDNQEVITDGAAFLKEGDAIRIQR